MGEQTLCVINMDCRLFLRYVLILITLVPLLSISCGNSDETAATEQVTDSSEVIKLPEPRYESEVSLEESLVNRRSTRSYGNEPLTLQELSQLLWAAQGITDASGHRTAPSAVALYPLTIYVVAGNAGTHGGNGFVGGFAGDEIEGRLLNEGILADFIRISAETRTNIIINDMSSGNQAVFSARGHSAPI